MAGFGAGNGEDFRMDDENDVEDSGTFPRGTPRPKRYRNQKQKLSNSMAQKRYRERKKRAFSEMRQVLSCLKKLLLLSCGRASITSTPLLLLRRCVPTLFWHSCVGPTTVCAPPTVVFLWFNV